jgi:hypothetical protein
MRTLLGLVIGTNVQAQDAGLQSIAGLTTAADQSIYTTALDTYATFSLTSVARTLLAQTSQANMRTTGLGLGTSATVATGTSGATIPLLNGANTHSGANVFSGSLTHSAAAFATGIISPTALAADTNDWAPTSFATCNVIRASATTTSRNLTGLAGGASGRRVTIHNVGSINIVLVDESASSTAANRFALEGNITLTPDSSVTLWWDTTSSRWRAEGRTAVTGDVTSAGSALTIAAGVVTFAKMASAAIASASEYLANTASKLISVAAAWAAAVPVTITFAASQTLDFNTFINGKITLTANMTLQTPTNLKPGQCGCIEFIQDATGSRTLNMTNASFISASGTDITLSTAANARDLIFYQVLADSKVLLNAVKAVA